MELSQRSQKFLEKTKLYLISSGKNEKEVAEVIEELQVHLLEAESRGKSVDDLTGQSPKVYMDQISKEMSFDYKDFLKYVTMFIVVAISFLMFNNFNRGGLSYSVLELVGYPFIFLLVLLSVALVFKYIASHSVSSFKEGLIYLVVGFIQIFLFIALILLNKVYQTPQINLGTTGSILAIGGAILLFLGLSIWSRTWILMFVFIVMYFPNMLEKFANLQDHKNGLIIIYLFQVLVIGIFIGRILLRTKRDKK